MSVNTNNQRPTSEQQRAIDKATRLKTSFKLIAFAGTGKTTTLIHCSRALQEQNKKGLYLSFNKKMAEEASSKFSKHGLNTVNCSTFHSLAYRNIPNWLKTKINKPTLLPKDIVRIFKLENYRVQYNGKNKQLSDLTLALIILNTLRYFCMSVDNKVTNDHSYQALSEQTSINRNEDLEQKITSIAAYIWEDVISENGQFGITHDYYLKWWVLQKPILDYHYIMVDESQDSDLLILEVLKRQKAKVIYVGDPYQQIYSFRGAKNILQNLDLEALYLEQSFRFGNEIAATANLLLNRLFGETRKVKGLPTKKATVTNYSNSTASPSSLDAIICRTNATAFEYFFKFHSLLDGSKKIRLEVDGKRSKEIFSGIFELRSGKKPSCKDLQNFNSYQELEEHIQVFGEVEGATTELKTFLDLTKQYSWSVIKWALENSIVEDDSKDKKSLIISTAHKSKGLEWNNVLIAKGFNYKILDNKLHISADEKRLLYVTVTRAQSVLYTDGIDDLLKYLNTKTKEMTNA
ncbi:UvrD-helicase domain-containing protein [Acinetobacter gandensis]|uniref:UvrD-helicase domain-containing protein n=1 Tax=Acinetobacter gandensis TaxID=1443941 RepID=UPI003989B5DB